jgi:hypothetical protein
MNSTPTLVTADRLLDVFGPVADDLDPRRRRLLLARRAIAVVGTVVTLVEIIVWLAIAVAGGGLDAPWWLWTAVPAAAAVAALTLASRPARA